MTSRLAFIVLAFVPMAFGQTPEIIDKSSDRQPAGQQPADDTQKSQGEAQRSTLQVQPGPPVIKQKDIWNETGVFHPFVRMPKYLLQDQKAIWTSPIHTVKEDVKYWAIFGAATAAFIATDRWTVKQLPNSAAAHTRSGSAKPA
jgi:DMSO/TMAO reductase YedYZ molybdopterin-dependent catalytic subunit